MKASKKMFDNEFAAIDEQLSKLLEDSDEYKKLFEKRKRIESAYALLADDNLIADGKKERKLDDDTKKIVTFIENKIKKTLESAECEKKLAQLKNKSFTDAKNKTKYFRGTARAYFDTSTKKVK